MPLASFRQVSRLYATGQGVRNLNFSLMPGQRVGLLGLNGSGKTTTMKLLAGLLIPDQGSILIADESPRKARQCISFLSDKASFDMWMKPQDVKNFMTAFYGDFRGERFEDLCSRLKVPSQAVSSMSKGQQQRLRLAASFARKASLHILDEPLSGIDVISREMILQILWENREPGSCVVISTHEIKEVEPLLDRALILLDGSLVYDQLSSELAGEQDSFTRRFVEIHS